MEWLIKREQTGTPRPWTIRSRERRSTTATPIADLKIDPATPLFKVRSFTLLFTTRVASNTANQMLAVAVGYQVYELTDSALHLGLIGFVQFMPPLLLMLVAGQVADRYNRRLILRCCYAVEFCTQAVARGRSRFFRSRALLAIYVLLLTNAIARTFEQPVMQSLVPVMAPRVIWAGRSLRMSPPAGCRSCSAPRSAGVLYVFGPDFDYGVCTLLMAVAAIASFLLPNPPVPAERPKVNWAFAAGGLPLHLELPGGDRRDVARPDRHAVRRGEFAAADLCARHPRHRPMGRRHPAQLAGGRRAPDRRVLTRFPITRNGGVYIFVGFAFYGLGVTVFGLSTNVALSISALLLLGGRRHGELGGAPDHRAGDDARRDARARRRRQLVLHRLLEPARLVPGRHHGGSWLGAVGSVVVGGCAVFLTVALWMWLFPSLRRVDRPDEAQPYGSLRPRVRS